MMREFWPEHRKVISRLGRAREMALLCEVKESGRVRGQIAITAAYVSPGIDLEKGVPWSKAYSTCTGEAYPESKTGRICRIDTAKGYRRMHLATNVLHAVLKRMQEAGIEYVAAVPLDRCSELFEMAGFTKPAGLPAEVAKRFDAVGFRYDAVLHLTRTRAKGLRIT